MANRLVQAVNLGHADEALAEALREPEEWARPFALAIVHHASKRRAVSEDALRKLVATYGETAGHPAAQAEAGGLIVARTQVKRRLPGPDAAPDQMKRPAIGQAIVLFGGEPGTRTPDQRMMIRGKRENWHTAQQAKTIASTS